MTSELCAAFDAVRAATVALAIAGGADLVRVHDVRAMARVARMTDAVVRCAPAEARTWAAGTSD